MQPSHEKSFTLLHATQTVHGMGRANTKAEFSHELEFSVGGRELSDLHKNAQQKGNCVVLHSDAEKFASSYRQARHIFWGGWAAYFGFMGCPELKIRFGDAGMGFVAKQEMYALSGGGMLVTHGTPITEANKKRSESQHEVSIRFSSSPAVRVYNPSLLSCL